MSPRSFFSNGVWTRPGLGSLDERSRSSTGLFLFLVSFSLSPDRYLMVYSHLLHANLGDGANETWRPSSPHPLPKSQTKRPRTYQSDYSTNGGQVARGQRIGEGLGLYRGRRTRDSRNSVMPSMSPLQLHPACMLRIHVSFVCRSGIHDHMLVQVLGLLVK